MKGFIIALLTVAVVGAMSFTACFGVPPAAPPAEAPSEPEIPAHFSSYSKEGLFSISYPPEWEPATSVMEELLEQSKEWVESVDPEAILEGAQILFFGGLPTEEGWWPNVNILVGPRSVGYWALDEIVEADARWAREYTQEYREFSRAETVIDATEAIIIDSQDYDPEFGTCRYLQAYVVKGKHVWIVTCTVDAKDFRDYENTFHSVVRSLRILK